MDMTTVCSMTVSHFGMTISSFEGGSDVRRCIMRENLFFLCALHQVCLSLTFTSNKKYLKKKILMLTLTFTFRRRKVRKKNQMLSGDKMASDRRATQHMDFVKDHRHVKHAGL